MPINLPTPDRLAVSFGPGRLFLGIAGATPTVDVGQITEDGISLSFTSEKGEIRQGNPRLLEDVFVKSQDLMVKITGIEWDMNNIALGLGAGVTSNTASVETFEWGGDPLATYVALQVQHQMGFAAGQTLNVNVWKAVTDSGIDISLGQDEHKFPFAYKAMRSSLNWAGGALTATKQLVLIQRQKQ